jgi:hypothetical protein
LRDYSLPFDGWLLEVDEQAEVELGDTEVVQALGEVLVAEAVRAFEFDDDGVFDEDVGVVVADAGSFVGDGEGGLAGREVLEVEFAEEGAFVDFFEEADAEGVGDFEEGADDAFGECVRVGVHLEW